MELTVEDLQILDRKEWLRGKQSAHGLIRLVRGVYLADDRIPTDVPSWHIRRLITIARSLAIVVASRHQVLPTMEAALALQSIPTWWNTCDIAYRCLTTSKSHRAVVPSIEIRGTTACEVESIPLRRAGPQPLTKECRGIRVCAPTEAVADIAQCMHPLSAFVDCCMTMRAGHPRKDLLQVAASRKGNGRVRARHIISAADGRVENPAEAAVLWLLLCMVPPDLSVDVQREVVVQGRLFRLDFAFPDFMVAIEFDGRSKLAPTEDSPDPHGDFLTRQRLLLSAGWRIIRIQTGQLRDIERLARTLRDNIKPFGVLLSTPRGPIWKPVPRSLIEGARRF